MLTYIPRFFYSLSESTEELDVGIGICGWIMTAVSWLLILVTLPFSLFFCFKVSPRVSPSVSQSGRSLITPPSRSAANDGVQLALLALL